MTRVDASYNVNVLCAGCSAPTREWYAKALGVLGYLLKTKHLRNTFGGKLRVPTGLTEYPPHFAESHGLHTYHDSSFGKPRPMGGYVVMYCNGPVDWGAGALKIIPDSTQCAAWRFRTRAKAKCFVRELLRNNGINP